MLIHFHFGIFGTTHRSIFRQGHAKFSDDYVCIWPVLRYSLALYICIPGDHGPIDE
jgi:hypothetical protein